MRTDILHQRVVHDVEAMRDGVDAVFPVKMPVCYESRKMNLGSFVKRLNSVTEGFNVLNVILNDPVMPKGAFVTSGLWYPEEWLPEDKSDADVRILWHPNPSAHRVNVTPLVWNRRRYYFWERLAHELVHRHQNIFRGPDSCSRTFRVHSEDQKTKEDQQYYGDYDELEAYAHDAAMELHTWWPNCTMQQAIGKAKQAQGIIWSTYDNYMSTFAPGHPARKRFVRKLRSWYHTMQQTPDFYEKLALPKLV